MGENMTNNIIIVGGGYLGAMCALMFSQNKDLKVTVIEKQRQLGGLYNSAWQKDDLFFDFGSRAILATGVEQLDNLLFSFLPDDEYPKSTANLKEYSFQNGTFCGHSNCLDARFLEPTISQAGISEMLAIKYEDVQGNNYYTLDELANATYGPILTEHLIRPSMEKLTGLPLEELDKNAMAIHGLNRIIIADREQSKLLKKQSDFNDNRIAFAKFDDNKSSQIKTYPQTLGLKDFCNRIETYLEAAPNVDLVLGNSVAKILSGEELIDGIVLEDGAQISCDRILWTIPSIFLARLLNKEIQDIVPPKFRNTVLAHYTFTGDLNSDAYYVYNYDLDYLTYRATFYDNFSQRPKNLHSVTIEAFWDEKDVDLDRLEKDLFQELIKSECIAQTSKAVASNLHLHRGSWPNFASNFFENQHLLNEAVIGDYKNLDLLGKANGKHHSGALVQSAYELYQELL